MQIMRMKRWKTFEEGELCGVSHFVKRGAPRGKSMAYIARKSRVKNFEICSSKGNLEVEEIQGAINYAWIFRKLCTLKTWSFTKLQNDFERWGLIKVWFFKHDACLRYVELFIKLMLFYFETTFQVGSLQELTSVVVISSSYNFDNLGLSLVWRVNPTR